MGHSTQGTKRPRGRGMIRALFLWLACSLPLHGALSAEIFSEDYRYNVGVATGVLAGTYFMSEMKDGPAVFAGIYAGATLYLLNENSSDFTDVSDLVLPAGLMTLAIVNVALLSDDEYDHHDVFIWNLSGLTALAAYAYWEQKYKNSVESLLSHFVAVSDGHTSRFIFHTRF